jgi:hypothetical protein
MKIQSQTSGYILLLTLMIISLCVVLVTYMFNKGAVEVPFSYAMIKREKAKQLALSGIQMAMSQLGKPIEIKQEKAPAPAQPPVQQTSSQDKAIKQYIERVVPTLNRWQTFNLNEKNDGIDGQIKIAISSEEGKIDINQWFDYKNKKFKSLSILAPPSKTDQKNDQQKPQQDVGKIIISIAFKNVGKDDLMSEFEKFLKERQYRLDDVTELLQIKGFETFKHRLFYEPPTQAEESKKGERPVYLSDIFTVWSGKMQIDPWLLSDASAAMLGLKRVEANDVEQRKKAVQEAMKDFKGTFEVSKDWKKLFEPLYGKDFASLPKGIELIFTNKFAPRIFSVLSYGKVGDVTQKLLAIVESNQEFKENTLSFTMTIKKLLWL